jgi:4-diphosphocytidyl-2-C-methyl-D-erythritol kinase
VRQHLCNDLETVAEAEYPGISEAKEALLEQGANGVLMSGSGSTVFGLFLDSHRARSAYQNLPRKRQWEVFIANLIT